MSKEIKIKLLIFFLVFLISFLIIVFLGSGITDVSVAICTLNGILVMLFYKNNN